jgi:hypothetical protein
MLKGFLNHLIILSARIMKESFISSICESHISVDLGENQEWILMGLLQVSVNLRSIRDAKMSM